VVGANGYIRLRAAIATELFFYRTHSTRYGTRQQETFMELCIGAYAERGACLARGPSDPAANLTPIPSTPVASSSAEEEIRDTSMLYTPSPIFLNPMTEEDWSTRKKITSSLHLTLASETNEFTRKLTSGVQLQLHLHLPGGNEQRVERRAVTMRFDESKSLLCITFEDEEDEKKGDDDTAATATEPLHIPVSSISKIRQSEESDDDKCLFTIQLRYAILLPELGKERDSLQFECASVVKKQKIIEGLQTLLDRPPQLLRRRSSRVLPRSFSPLDGRFSPMSLTEDPSREDAISPSSSVVNDDSSPVRIQKPQPQRLVRMHEAVPSVLVTSSSYFNKNKSMTPSEQGMELMLVDMKDMRSNDCFDENGAALKIPMLSDGSTDSSSGLEQQQVGELLGFNNYSTDPEYAFPLNPWCGNADNAACSLNEVASAFNELSELGGVKTTAAKDSKDAVEDLLFGSGIAHGSEPTLVASKSNEIQRMEAIHRDAEDLHCLGAALLVAEEMVDVPYLVAPEEWSMSRKASSDNLNRRNQNIRNRAGDINRQARHLKDLRNNMTFEAVYSKRLIPHLQIIKSMDEDTTEIKTRAHSFSEPRQLSLFQAVDDVFDSLYGFDFNAVRDSEEGLLYYDSDPEHVRERTCRRGSRQATAEHWNRSYKRRRFPKLQIPKHILRRSSSLSDGDIKVVVDLMKSCKLYLIWHPNPKQDSRSSTPRPCCIQAWVERGTYLLNQNFVQPKFMWKPTFEGELGNRRKINLSVEYFDLLEIARIDNSPEAIDRSVYPLAHRPSCFSIKTKSDYFLFQAQSVGEKFQIVFGLKLVVARLASLLIVRDTTAVEEFFEPVDAVVPGQAPSWATGK
jgi:hypothetical protein